MSALAIQHTGAALAFNANLPQANTDSCEADALTLRTMQARLHSYINQVDVAPAQLPSTVYLPEPDGRQHRVVLLNKLALRTGGQLPFVGFFGHKRPTADVGLLDALDAELIAELRDYPHMLSYSSLELPDGSWGNLVVMSSPEGAMHWAGSARHAHAVYEVAPTCYLSIRLHSGMMTLNGPAHDQLQIKRTKHFDYSRGNC